MFRIIDRSAMSEWSARIVLAESEYRKRSRYPLCRMGDAQEMPNVKSCYLSALRTTPSFVRYHAAMMANRNDLRRELALFCPIPPLSVQREIEGIERELLRESFELSRLAQIEECDAWRWFQRNVGLRLREYPTFGALRIIKQEELASWSARVLAQSNHYICDIHTAELGEVLRSPINRSRHGRPEVKDSYINYKVLQPAGLGVGVLRDKVLGSRPGQGVKRRAVPMGCVVFNRLRPEQSRHWINDGTYGSVLVESSDLLILDLDEEKINAGYFSLVIQLNYVQDQLKLYSDGRVLPRIRIEMLNSIRIPLPDLVQQQALVGAMMPRLRDVRMKNARAAENKRNFVNQIERVLFHEVEEP